MLQTLRDKSSGWIATVILGLLCIPFAFFGMEQYLFQASATYAAKIEAPPTWWPSAPNNGFVRWLFWQEEEISTDEFRTSFEQMRQQQRQMEGEAFDSRAFESVDSKRQVLDGLVDRRIMRMLAQREGLAVGDATLRETIESVPAFQVAGSFDPQSYQLALSTQGQTPRQFEQIVRDDLQQTIIPRGIADSAFVTKSEVDRLLALIGETRSASYVVLPAPAADTAPVPDAEIQRAYQQNASRYRLPEAVTLEVLDVEAAKLPAVAAPDEAALRARYAEEQAKFGAGEQRLVSHILVKDQAKANTIAAQAKAAGADFAALASANSEDAGSKAGGGDLGWIEKNGAMVKPFEDAVFAMDQGEIRGPVQSDFGYHVIQVREIKAGQQKPFEEVREQLLAEQTVTDQEKAFNELLGKLVDEVYKNPTTLAAAATMAGLPIRTVAGVTRVPSATHGADPVLSNQAVLRTAFTESLIQDGTVSDPVEIAPGHSVLLRVKAHVPERAQPLAQVRDQVIATIRAERTAKAATAAADAVLAQVRGGQTLAQAATARGLEVVDLPDIPRGAPVPDPLVNQALFNVPAPAAGKGSPGTARMIDGRMAVFVVNKVTLGEAAKATPEQRVQLQQQLAQVGGVEDAQALVRALRKRLNITVAEDRL